MPGEIVRVVLQMTVNTDEPRLQLPETGEFDLVGFGNAVANAVAAAGIPSLGSVSTSERTTIVNYD